MRILITALVLLCIPASCLASNQTSTFQCNNGIVSLGSTESEVVEKCGQPTSITYVEVEPDEGSAAYRKRHRKPDSQEWKYNLGPNQFMYLLVLREGKVSSIVSLNSYGK